MTHAPRRICFVFFLGFFCLRAVASNDTFADATDLTGQPLPHIQFVGGTGTAETGEPAHAGSPAAQSFWFQWQAGIDQPVAFSEFVNGTNARIGIYTGTAVDALTLVAQGTSKVFFAAQAGVRYRIAIDSPDSDVIQLRAYSVGGADDVANATLLTSSPPFQTRGNNIFATAAEGDPDLGAEHPANHSVWWVWTAPASGALRVDTRLSDFGPMLSVLERPPGGTATKISAGLDSAGFSVTAGNDYLICVDSFMGEPGEISLWFDWVPTGPPPNDNIANATDLGNATIVCDGAWLLFATPEAGQPNEDIGFPQWGIPGDRTAWWKWTCPESGYYRFSTLGSNYYAGLYLYSGTPGALSYLGNNENLDGVRISATAGTTYWLQVRDWRKVCTRAEVNIHPALNEPSYFSYFDNRGVVRLFGHDRHPSADPDGDSFSNQIEFACGGNPELNDPSNPALPHLLPVGDGTWKLQWREDTYYLQSTTSVPMTLTGQVSGDLTGAWTAPPRFIDPDTGARFIYLPNGSKGFGRLEFHDPNFSLVGAEPPGGP